MENLIKNNKKEFIFHYSKYQFVLNIETRKEFQNKMIDDEDIMKVLMIKNNILPDICLSIRNILENILIDIKNLKNSPNIDLDLLQIFINNNVYFDSLFNYLIPTRFSDNLEYKYSKLLFDLVHFFFPWEKILETKDLKEEEKK